MEGGAQLPGTSNSSQVSGEPQLMNIHKVGGWHPPPTAVCPLDPLLSRLQLQWVEESSCKNTCKQFQSEWPVPSGDLLCDNQGVLSSYWSNWLSSNIAPGAAACHTLGLK